MTPTHPQNGSAKTEPKGNLWQRLCRVHAEVAGIPKNGTAPSTMGGFAFVRDVDVYESARHLFAQHGVIYCPPSMVSAETVEAGTTSTGKPIYRSTVRMRYRLRNADVPEEFEEWEWWGEGDDGHDKGIAKAATSATKQTLMKALLIGGGPAEDPDAVDATEGEGRGKAGARQRKPTRRVLIPEGVTPRTCPNCADNLVVIHTDAKGSFVGHDKTRKEECARPAISREDSGRLIAACPDPDPLPKEPPAPERPVEGMPLVELCGSALHRLNDLVQFDADAARRVVIAHGWKEDGGQKSGEWIRTITDPGALVRLISDLNEAIKTSPAPIP